MSQVLRNFIGAGWRELWLDGAKNANLDLSAGGFAYIGGLPSPMMPS